MSHPKSNIQSTYEVEVKFQLMPNSKDKSPNDCKIILYSNLQKHNLQHHSTVIENDSYFNHSTRDFAVTDEALRLRVVENLKTHEKQCELTYKGPKLFSEGKTRKELNINISNESSMKEILTLLGFSIILNVKKTREKWTGKYLSKEILVTIDDVDQLGVFVELEVTAYSQEEARQQTLNLLAMGKKLGFDQNIRKSYLELLIERQKSAIN